MYGDNPSLFMLYAYRIDELVKENQQLKESNEKLKSANKHLFEHIRILEQILDNDFAESDDEYYCD